MALENISSIISKLNTGPGRQDGIFHPEDLATISHQPNFSYMKKHNSYYTVPGNLTEEPVSVWIGYKANDDQLPIVAISCPPLNHPF